MATKKDKSAEKPIEIQQIKIGRLTAHLVGTSPLIMHRFAFKAWQELLLPSRTMNSAQRAESLKHDPLNEYRESLYRNRDPSEPTLFHFPSGAFSKAMAAAALDLPGATKAQILRLVSVASAQINIYGVPTLGMDMVRSSDMARTPDVRTRAYLPEWCCKLDIEFVASLIGENQVANLLGAAGRLNGIGDWRPQKGGSLGKFKLVNANDPDYRRIMKQGRDVQLAAYNNPAFYSEDSAELYGWFVEEVARREKTLPSSLTDLEIPEKFKAKIPA